MRSWQLLSAFVVLTGWPHGVEAQTSTGRASLVIPETAPTKAPTDPPVGICGAGLISPAEYQEWWSYWRAVALSAASPAQRECRAFALIQLAELPSRTGRGHLGAPYWHAAVETLESFLSEGDPRLASVRLKLAWTGGLSTADKERLIRSSLAALETAVAHPKDLSELGCDFLRESANADDFQLSGLLRAATPADQRRLLSEAQLALLRLFVEAGRTQEALAVARATRQHLARRLELDGAHGRSRGLANDASSLVRFLERLPSAQLPPQQLTDAVDLLEQAAQGVESSLSSRSD